MNIPKRYIWVAAGAAATFAVMAIRNRVAARETNAAREEAARERASRREAAATTTTTTTVGEAERAAPPLGAAKELDAFLAGDTWHDETGWKAIWEREAIADAAAWIRAQGMETLRARRQALRDHPALLAGCRRRWIVVCRYAAVDVSEAASLWNATDG